MVTAHRQSRLLSDDLPKITLFWTMAENTSLKTFFSKCSLLKTTGQKGMKPAANGHIYSRISYPEKSHENIEPFFWDIKVSSVGPLRAALKKEMTD